MIAVFWRVQKLRVGSESEPFKFDCAEGFV